MAILQAATMQHLPGMRTTGEPSDVRRRQWFAEHVPWHRLNNVVDVTHDAGVLMADVMADFSGTALVVDLSGNPRRVRERLAPFADRVTVRPGDVLTELPAGSDYYLLPDNLEHLDSGRLGRLMRAVSQACLPSGRAIACIPADCADELIRSADRAGLEVTRQGGDEATALIEFGSGPLRALPGE